MKLKSEGVVHPVRKSGRTDLPHSSSACSCSKMFKQFHHQKDKVLILIGFNSETQRIHVGDWAAGCSADAVEIMLQAALLHAQGTGVFSAAHDAMKKKRAPRGSKKGLK